MFLHLQIPGFHAVVHQAFHPAARGRPVAVAVDAGLQAPLFATSPEARVHHIQPGVRADEALRRCPGLIVVPPDPDAYRQVQRRLGAICAAFTPRVGGTAGRLDLDLAATGTLWQRSEGSGPLAGPEMSARGIAGEIRRRCAQELSLDVYVGGSARLFVARLAAHLARAPHVAGHGVIVVAAGDEAAVTDLMPVTLVTDCAAHVRELLERCGISTIGQLRALSADDLVGLVGPDGADLYESVHGLREEVVPELVEPEPAVSATCRSGAGGAGPDGADAMITVLARELGFHLRQRQLACTRLALEVTWLDARATVQAMPLSYQSAHDLELGCAARALFAKANPRGALLARLRLTGSGLCTMEQQQELFACERTPRPPAARAQAKDRSGSGPLRGIPVSPSA